MGSGSFANGAYSHTEGLSVSASGNYSHAEGRYTIAKADYSHTEGYGNISSGSDSHAEGRQNVSYGRYSHAEGQNTSTYGEASHAEGFGTVASGNWAHAEGIYATANGTFSHAEGDTTVAFGSASHAEGRSTVAYGAGSHAEGIGTIASGSYQTAVGSYNKQNNTTSLFVIGDGTSEGSRKDVMRVSSSMVQITGSLIVSSSGTGTATFIGSGSTLVTVLGSQGELFSVTDSLTGSLFSVNDISGLPILNVQSDQTIQIGSYLSPATHATVKVLTNTSQTTIYSFATSSTDPAVSYDSVYYDYNIRSGSNARVGQIMAMWSGNSVNYLETSASQFGNTSGFVFGVYAQAGSIILSGSASTNGWTVKTIIRSI